MRAPSRGRGSRTRLPALLLGGTLAWAALAAPPARAQLYLGWNACWGDSAAVANMNFSCDATVDTTLRLVGTFSTPEPLERIVAFDGVIDFLFPAGGGIPPFWHFENAGCNNSGLTLSDARPGAGCQGNSNALCGRGGTLCDGMITAYFPGLGGPDRGRLLIAVVRRSDDPVRLAAAPARHFAFELVFSMDQADPTCEGCRRPVAVRWTHATAHGVDEKREKGTEVLGLRCDEPGGNPFVTVNGASPAACDSTAVPSR